MKRNHPVPLRDPHHLLDHPTLYPGWALPIAAAAFLSTPTFWILLGAIAAIAVVGAIYTRSRRERNRGLPTEEENRLWRELAQAHKGKAAPQSRELVSRLTAYREDPETAPAADVVDDARNVADLFRTLRRDQAKEPTPVEAPTAEGEEHEHLSVEPNVRPAESGMFGTTGRGDLGASPAYLTPPPAAGRMSMERPAYQEPAHWPSFPNVGQSVGLQSWPGLAPRDQAAGEVPGAWPAALEELPFQIRMDITDRLETDLEWAQPDKASRTQRAPAIIERNRSAVEKRRYERMRRQVDLTKQLLRSGEGELRKQGVELAVRLEEDLHAIRARRVKRAHRK